MPPQERYLISRGVGTVPGQRAHRTPALICLWFSRTSTSSPH